MTRRIPEDQPYVVRPSAIKRGLAYAKIVSVLALVVSGPGALANISDPGTALLNMLGVVGFVLAISVLPLGPQLWLLSSGGPVLALSPAGLWIRTRPSRGQAVWLPWEAVAQIGRHRRGMENTLLVQPGDPRSVRQFGAAVRCGNRDRQEPTERHLRLLPDGPAELRRSAGGGDPGGCQTLQRRPLPDQLVTPHLAAARARSDR
ncbi:hypothetical protein [Melissospora conviva]|uniref:hypothetical protein n=1 Tax=Melissospora conviva TaxID=3388432 RepID=UPI003B7C3F51